MWANWSLWEDVKILLRTIPHVMDGEVSRAMSSKWFKLKTEVRSLARRLGVLPLVQHLQHLAGNDRKYEVKFGRALREAIHEGDTVWDVGANLGLYTQMFSDWVGPKGHVVAFEPVPSCFSTLCDQTQGCSNVTTLNVGLGDARVQLPMHLAEDPQGATHTFIAPQRADGAVVELAVYPGDTLREAERLPVPNVLKIDVEGFEPEVVRGLDTTLRDTNCRTVLCEVHFRLLESRGQKHAPEYIQSFLCDRGFTVKWIDASHLGAYRD